MSRAAKFKTVRLLLLLFALSFAARVGAAQETFEIRGASKIYDVTVSVEGCGGEGQNNSADTCSGRARVSISRKGVRKPFQVLTLENVELYTDTLAYNPETSEKPRGLYAEEYSVVFDDFDFNGAQDIAVCNGRNGGYSGPSYNVYLFNKQSNRFVENRRLTELTEGVYLGLFFPDPKKKLLVAYSKSGCCFHQTDKFRVVKNRPVLVESIIEDAFSGEGKFVTITTKRLVGGRWVKKVRKEKMKEEN
jgi:hypothetical protein